MDEADQHPARDERSAYRATTASRLGARGTGGSPILLWVVAGDQTVCQRLRRVGIAPRSDLLDRAVTDVARGEAG
jgi:hypothetical protein